MKPLRPALPAIAIVCLLAGCETPKAPAPATPEVSSKAGEAKATAATKTTDAKASEEPKAATKAGTAAGPDAPAPALEPPKPVAPRTVLFYRETPKDRIEAWVLPEPSAADPTAARKLSIVADLEGGDVYHGTSGPVLSADAQWLAYLDEGRLQLARLDGTANHRITKHKGNRVTVLISGFSPDSSRLMFYQGEVQSEEGTALPKGVVQGQHELVLADLRVEPKTSLEAFASYADDGRHVVFQRQLPTRQTVLFLYDLETGAEEELQRTTESFGFVQLVLHGERIAYSRSPAQGRSRIAADALRGGARIDISPEGAFAQLQWPRISRDGRMVSYVDETNVMVRSLDPTDTPRVLVTCAQRHCDHAWDGADTVIVRDGGKLSRVSLDGKVTALAEDVDGFVVAGDPG